MEGKRGFGLGWVGRRFTAFLSGEWTVVGAKCRKGQKNLKKRSFSERKGAGLAKVSYFSFVEEEKRLTSGKSLSKKDFAGSADVPKKEGQKMSYNV